MAPTIHFLPGCHEWQCPYKEIEIASLKGSKVRSGVFVCWEEWELFWRAAAWNRPCCQPRLKGQVPDSESNTEGNAYHRTFLPVRKAFEGSRHPPWNRSRMDRPKLPLERIAPSPRPSHCWWLLQPLLKQSVIPNPAEAHASFLSHQTERRLPLHSSAFNSFGEETTLRGTAVVFENVPC